MPAPSDKKRVGKIVPVSQSAPSRKSAERIVREKIEARLRRIHDEVMEVVNDCLTEEREGKKETAPEFSDAEEGAHPADDPDIPF